MGSVSINFQHRRGIVCFLPSLLSDNCQMRGGGAVRHIVASSSDIASAHRAYCARPCRRWISSTASRARGLLGSAALLEGDVSVCQDSLMDDDGCDDGFILSASLANNNVRAGIARYKARKSRRRYRRARLVNFNIIFQQWRADVMVYIRRRRRRHIWRLTPLGVSPRGGSCGLTTTPGSGVQLRARIIV